MISGYGLDMELSGIQAHLPESRVAARFHSSFSFGVKPFIFSSSSRAFFIAISLSNLSFQTLKDSIVTGVPRVRDSSAYGSRLFITLII